MEAGNKIKNALSLFDINENVEIQNVTNGVNSNVYIIDKKFVLKFYRTDNNIPTRLQREVYALELFSKNSIHNVPQVIGYSEKLNCSLLTLLEGHRISEFRSELIDQFEDFYKSILNLNENKSNINFLSIDSCLELKDLILQVEDRIFKLESEQDKYLDNTLHILKDMFYITYSRVNEKYYNSLSPEFSVVDFGINNVILNNTKLSFIDFEFFGIDNPIHLISDCIAHPANNLVLEDQLILSNKLCNCHKNAEEIKFAFNGTNILFDIKWCLIMLNPFLTSYSLNVVEVEREKKKLIQLEKVNNKIKIIEQKIKNEKFLY